MISPLSSSPCMLPQLPKKRVYNPQINFFSARNSNASFKRVVIQGYAKEMSPEHSRPKCGQAK